MSAPLSSTPRGLPGPLPKGERLIWQGAPRWTALARRAFHLPAVAVYFGVLALWRAGAVWLAGDGLGSALLAGLWLVAIGSCAIGLFALYGWLVARSTVYSITSRRVVIQFGVALPMTVNVPFSLVESAAAKVFADGTADLPLRLGRNRHVSWLVLWPHVRPWRLGAVEPMFRAVPDGRQVATILAEALADAARTRTAETAPEDAAAPQPEPKPIPSGVPAPRAQAGLRPATA